MKNLIVFLILCFQFSFNSWASGVPTADVAAVTTMIAENLKNLEKQAEQITQLKDQLEHMKAQAKAQARRFEGNIGKLLNTDSLYSILGENLDKILSNTDSVGHMRELYGLNTSNTELQKSFDQDLKKLKLLEDNFQASVKRTSDLIQLKERATTAQTPTQKQDIANEIAYQQAQLQNELIKLEQVRQAQDQRDILKMRSRNKNHNENVSRLMNERWQ